MLLLSTHFLFPFALPGRDSTRHELAIQVGIPSRGSTQRISTMYAANNSTGHNHSNIVGRLRPQIIRLALVHARVDCLYTTVPNKAPMPAVIAIASAPQNVTRATPIRMRAPPV